MANVNGTWSGSTYWVDPGGPGGGFFGVLCDTTDSHSPIPGGVEVVQDGDVVTMHFSDSCGERISFDGRLLSGGLTGRITATYADGASASDYATGTAYVVSGKDFVHVYTSGGDQIDLRRSSAGVHSAGGEN